MDPAKLALMGSPTCVTDVIFDQFNEGAERDFIAGGFDSVNKVQDTRPPDDDDASFIESVNDPSLQLQSLFLQLPADVNPSFWCPGANLFVRVRHRITGVGDNSFIYLVQPRGGGFPSFGTSGILGNQSYSDVFFQSTVGQFDSIDWPNMEFFIQQSGGNANSQLRITTIDIFVRVP